MNPLQRQSCLILAFVAASAAVGPIGCGALDALGLRRPTARVAGVRLGDITFTDATLLFDVEVENPYSVPLPLANFDYRLASQDATFLTGSADVQGTIPEQGKKTVSLPARLVYVEVLRALTGVRPGAVVPYEAEVGLSVDAPAVGRLRLPLRREGKLPIPSVPDVRIAEIQWDEVTLDNAGGLIKLAVVNRNQFPMDLSRLTYALSLGDVQVASSSLQRQASFAASGGSQTLEIPVSFSPRDLGVGVFRTLLVSNSGYRLTGSLDVTTPFGAMALPIDKVGRTVLRR
jgi:LEA14-like dessication related protein